MSIALVLRGSCTVAIPAPHRTAAMNLCMQMGVQYSGFRWREDGSICFSCTVSSARRFLAACHKRDIAVEIVAYRGLPQFLKRIGSRAGLVVGGVLALTLMVLSGLFVWDVQVSGNVDVLTLTATPIPRTLNMAMSGIRDISVLDEAPGDRRPVQTYVLEHDNAVIYEAIRREMRRGGQVFYLHNRVQGIFYKAEWLKKHFPDINIAVAHGKMSENELEDIMYDMVNGKTDILVCTTIIETGLDIPNANTIIIENSDCL